jgi:LPPG:FO 2-phospho-L-lactate transferase
VRSAIEQASAIIIGPSNPIISIGPILAIDQLRQAVVSSRAPVVAVSPIVGGEVLKGPTAAFMKHRAVEVSAAGVAELYAGVIDGLVTDEQCELPVEALVTEILMDGPRARRQLAEQTLRFALELAQHASPSSFAAE